MSRGPRLPTLRRHCRACSAPILSRNDWRTIVRILRAQGEPRLAERIAEAIEGQIVPQTVEDA